MACRIVISTVIYLPVVCMSSKYSCVKWVECACECLLIVWMIWICYIIWTEWSLDYMGDFYYQELFCIIFLEVTLWLHAVFESLEIKNIIPYECIVDFLGKGIFSILSSNINSWIIWCWSLDKLVGTLGFQDLK